MPLNPAQQKIVDAYNAAGGAAGGKAANLAGSLQSPSEIAAAQRNPTNNIFTNNGGTVPTSASTTVTSVSPTTSNNGITTPTWDPTKYLGAGYTPGAATTSFGKLYQDSVAKRLAGEDSAVVAARGQQQTDSSRNQYVNAKAASEAALQGGQLPGSLPAQRGLDRAEAATSTANLAGEQDVNKLQRSSVSEGLQQAQGLEQSAKADADKRNSDLVNSVQDPKAKYFLQQVLASGGDVQAAYSGMFQNGTLRSELTSSTPAQTKLQGIKDELKLTNPNASDADLQTMAIAQLKREQDAANAPGLAADKEKAAANIKQNFKGTDWASPDNKAYLTGLEDVNPIAAFNSPKSVDAWVEANPGAVFKFNGQPYQVVRSNPDWVTSADGKNAVKTIEVIGQGGATQYLGNDGKLYAKTPQGYVAQ